VQWSGRWGLEQELIIDRHEVTEEDNTNEGTGQEYEVLIRCTHNDKKFAARVSRL